MNSTCALSAFIAAALIVAFPFASRAQSPELRALQIQYEHAVIDRVTDIYNVGLGNLDANYIAGLDRSLSDATAAGDLEGALSLQAEKKRIASKEALPANDEQASKILRKLRGIYRVEISKLDAQRAANQTAILTPHLEKLKQLEIDLTKATRLADAKAVMDYRQALASGVPLKGAITAASSPAVSSTQPAPVGSFTIQTMGGFTNTLGMKFVPVEGTAVLFCVHPTRIRDYKLYDADVSGVNGNWKTAEHDGIAISRGDNDPVVETSWDDAKGFCAWLSKKEGRAYRLPTDREWSIAVGLGEKEEAKKDATPESLNAKIPDVYPWGTQWPPSKSAGNYLDLSCKKKFPKLDVIPGYTDGFPLTSPVMSFKPNKFGLYDIGGNVFQWCEDWWDASKKQHVFRGASWLNSERKSLLSSYRHFQPPDYRFKHLGFRVVVESSR